MHETVEGLLVEAKRIIDGKIMYDGEIIQKINKMGVVLHFTKEGVGYSFKEEVIT